LLISPLTLSPPLRHRHAAVRHHLSLMLFQLFGCCHFADAAFAASAETCAIHAIKALLFAATLMPPPLRRC